MKFGANALVFGDVARGAQFGVQAGFANNLSPDGARRYVKRTAEVDEGNGDVFAFGAGAEGARGQGHFKGLTVAAECFIEHPVVNGTGARERLDDATGDLVRQAAQGVAGTLIAGFADIAIQFFFRFMKEGTAFGDVELTRTRFHTHGQGDARRR